MQGDDPRYLKTIATPKHYAVHSGPEPERHRFDAKAAERDLRETYLPAFRATVTEAHAASVMCAYNRTNGEPCCAIAVIGATRATATAIASRLVLGSIWGLFGLALRDD